ncbi:MAG: hypothetical protein Q9195_007763 [Heterodermia aff. obscurata]
MHREYVPSLFVALVMYVSASAADFLLEGRMAQQSASPTVTAASISGTSAAATASPSDSSDDDEIDQLINIKIDGKIFPPAISFDGSSIPQDFSVNCLNCSIIGNLSVSAGGGIGPEEITPPATFETAGSATDFDFSDFWVGVIVDSLSAHFDIAINLTASNNTNELIVPLHTFSKKISMQSGAGLLIPIDHLPQTKTYKFNESTLTPLPYTSTTGDLDMSLELSFRPKFDFAISATPALDGDMTAYFDVPKLDVQVSQVHNVTASCDAASPSLPKDQIYGNLTNVVPSIGFDASVIFSADEVIEHQSSRPFTEDIYAKNLSTACFEFDPAKKTLGPAAQAKPTGAKVGAAVRDHSWSRGLALASTAVVCSVWLGVGWI